MPVDSRSVKLARKAVTYALGGGLLLLPFLFGSYDRSRPSIIDPAFVFSTFHGGTGNEQGYDIAVDAAGNVFLTGYTTSANFPLRQPLQNNFRVIFLPPIPPSPRSGAICPTPSPPG
jgi:hypothetical protein